MRRFNPEKELNKIRHGNRNKLIFGMIFGIILLVIGYSFALYQVRYSKRIIYTKVAPFSNKDIELAVKVEGEQSNREEFPKQEEATQKGLGYIGIECEKQGTTTGFWNYDTWSLDLNTKGPNKCTVLFGPIKDFNEIIVADNETIFNDDPGKNLRYAGQDPNNYIWFNCDSYDNLTQKNAKEKCEKWRIIGLFNNITKIVGDKENLVKIIKVESIENIAWSSVKTNNWANATLQTSLTSYYNGTELGNAKGITSATRNMIEQVTWNLGSVGEGTRYQAKPSDYYNGERSTTIPSGARATWNGYIGLMYPSDYGYATGENSATRKSCLEVPLDNWSTSSYPSECVEPDWLWHSDLNQWTLTPRTDGTAVWLIAFTGGTSRAEPTTTYSIRPSLYLKSSVKMRSGAGTGNGSNETPYILVP